jgi:hypothetical protein
MLEKQNKAVTIFCCYAQEDEELRQELALHLSILRRAGLMQACYARVVDADISGKEAVDQRISEANIFLLLVSPAFLASKYCDEKEMRIILERHRQGEICAIPVLLCQTDWKHSSIGALEALPAGEKAVSDWANQDEALVEVVKGVRKAIALYWTALAVRQRISRLILEIQKLSDEIYEITSETKQISREIERMKPEPADDQGYSSTAGLEVEAKEIALPPFAHIHHSWLQEYREALDKLQNAAAASAFQLEQIEEFHTS